jgi:hypothetical protein
MMLLRERLTETNVRPGHSTTGATIMIRIAITTAIGLALSLSALTGAHASHRIGGAPYFESHDHRDYHNYHSYYSYYNYHNYCGYHDYCYYHPYFSYGAY